MVSVAIEASGLTKDFKSGKVKALDNLDLSINCGEIFGVIGPNGAGKTTFMSCVLGLLWPTSGNILINGQPPDSMEVHRSVGYLPERLNFVKWMTGYELMRFHAELLEISPGDREKNIESLLNLVELEKGAWSRKIKNYSRGMLQRVGMAQALLGSPSILLLDEPSSGLDPIGVRLFQKIVKDLKSTGVTIVINSHQLDQIERVCDRVAFIKGGKVKSLETMKTLSIQLKSVVLRWQSNLEDTVTAEKIDKIVTAVGAELINFEFPKAIVKVENDEMSANLLSELGRAEIQVAEASPREGRLESIFDGDGEISDG